jgi:hypothetical protein
MLMTGIVFLYSGESRSRPDKSPPLIQMAILLDTSGSMDGLIEQAKTQLWKIVNEMARAERGNRVPRLQVALYEYGKSSIAASEGYLRMIVPLSEDLDRISEELFKLRTNGGDEYCGRVISEATSNLRWSTESGDYRVIFIAGNEPFSQGRVDFRTSCRSAIARGIIVNTIFCGDHREGIRTHWKEGADLADGAYMNIDHNQKIARISAPQDKEIVALGRQLNDTYIAYGSAGKQKKERQKRQDHNALSVDEEVLVERSVAKASPQYTNSGWDMVDAVKGGRVKIEELEEGELPTEMKNMSPKERTAYVEEMKKKREAIQKKINKLNKERAEYVATQRKKTASGQTLDAAVVQTVRKQAGEKNYTFEKED